MPRPSYLEESQRVIAALQASKASLQDTLQQSTNETDIICKRVNQTLVAMIRKLMGVDYKDLNGYPCGVLRMQNHSTLQYPIFCCCAK